jgi:hypothetical protein
MPYMTMRYFTDPSNKLSSNSVGICHFLAAMILCAGCDIGKPPQPLDAVISPPTAKKSPGEKTISKEVQLPTCEERLATLSEKPRGEELGNYRKELPRTLLMVRVVPVLYFSLPKRNADPNAQTIWDEIIDSNRKRGTIRKLLKRYAHDKPFLRRVFLSQGYLFSNKPGLAQALVRELELEQLFDSEQVYLYRGDGIIAVHRHDKEYQNEDGTRAKILLNDRMAQSREELVNPLHLDLWEIRHLTGAQRVIPKTVDENQARVTLVFPDGEQRDALGVIHGEKTKILCIGGDQRTLKTTLARADMFWERHRKIVAIAIQATEERARFDEPTDEAEGVQEDGELRAEWQKAYFKRKRKFMFREVEYKIFDHRGNPIPPEVCVDFVFDVWERSSGTWYTPRSQYPKRTIGELDFRKFSGLYRRHIPSILAFAFESVTPIERYDIPRKDWRSFRDHKHFATKLSEHMSAVREGDALIIHGLREEDGEEHYHAVLVLETDPSTGLPTMVADNQGRPRIGSLSNAMRAAPQRSIKHRLRVHFDMVEDYLLKLAQKNEDNL